MKGRNYGVLFLLKIMLLAQLKAQEAPCLHPGWLREYGKLTHLVATEEYQVGYALADSLLSRMRAQGGEDCALYQRVRYEKAETLEIAVKFEDALTIYYSIAEKAQESGWYELLAETYLSMARVHEVIGRSEDCYEYLALAERLIEAHDLPATFSRYAVRISSYHRFFGSQERALHFAYLAITYGEKYQVSRSQVDGHLMVGILTKEKPIRLFHLRQAIRISLAEKDYPSAVWRYLKVALIHLENNQVQQAAKTMDTVSFYLARTKAKSYEQLRYVYRTKRTIFVRLQQIDSAYAYAEKLIELYEGEELRVNQEKINAQEKRFAIAQKQTEIYYERKQKEYLRWGLVGLGGVTLLLGFAFWRNNQQRKHIGSQKTKITQQNQELEQALDQHAMLLSEVHHRVKNNLQVIISLLTLEARNEQGGAT